MFALTIYGWDAELYHAAPTIRAGLQTYVDQYFDVFNHMHRLYQLTGAIKAIWAWFGFTCGETEYDDVCDALDGLEVDELINLSIEVGESIRAEELYPH